MCLWPVGGKFQKQVAADGAAPEHHAFLQVQIIVWLRLQTLTPIVMYHMHRHTHQGSQQHSLHIFDALEPKIIPFRFVLCMELTL